MTSKYEPTPFQEAFHDVTGEWPTPANVEAAMRDPDLKRLIDEQEQVIIDRREEEEAVRRDEEEAIRHDEEENDE